MKFLFNTRTDWDEPPRARHQLAKALAKNHQVIFVGINRKGKPSIQIEEVEDNITLITPYWFIHGKIVNRLPYLNEIYQKWLFKRITKQFNDQVHVINFDPSASLIHNYFEDVVYFCNDNFLDIKRSKSIIVTLYHTFTQKRICRKARFCAGVSVYLKEKLEKYNKHSYLILTAATQLQTNEIEKATEEETKNIVYIGWLSKLNKQWIINLAKHHDYKVYLVGPYTNKQVEGLTDIENVIITGEKQKDELNTFISKADVCIAPYKPGKDTEEVYTMPNKFWLYMNFGKPIVTCEIKNLYELPDGFVYQADDETDFVNKIEKAINENSKDLILERKEFIDKNSWESRVDQLLELYKHTN